MTGGCWRLTSRKLRYHGSPQCFVTEQEDSVLTYSYVKYQSFNVRFLKNAYRNKVLWSPALLCWLLGIRTEVSDTKVVLLQLIILQFLSSLFSAMQILAQILPS